MTNNCELCDKEGVFLCPSCKKAGYCTQEHRNEHWPKHKKECQPFRLDDDPRVGRRLVSIRKIVKGELVMIEAPLISGPPQATGPVCLGCHNGLDMPGYECTLCGWPLCSEECEKSPHHQPECVWAQTKRKKKVHISNFVVPHPTYGCITALRCLYQKEANPSLWRKITSLQSHKEERKGTEKCESDRFTVAQLLRNFYCLSDSFSEEAILEICGIIQINCHEVPLSEPRHVSLFYNGSFLEHSCRPNLSKSFTKDGKLLLRAAEDIPSDTSLTICYTDPLWSTPQRRLHLHHSKFFDCMCDRCRDPTELGTYFSAINCLTTEKCGGKMLPESFIVDVDKWKCNVCKGEATMETVGRLLSKEAEALREVSKQDTAELEDFIQKASKVLPMNHQYLTEAGLALVQLYGQKEGGLNKLPEKRLINKEELSEKLLHVTNLLAPGECRLRGVLWFELHAALAERARREPENSKTLLYESGRCLQETKELLSMEPDPLPEKLIYDQAVKNHQDLEKILAQIHIDAPV